MNAEFSPEERDLAALPKISLHDHLDGGLRPGTIIELAESIGYAVPATDADALGTWFAQQANSGSLPKYLETFAVTTAVMQTADGLERIAREFALDLHADGVIYGEVRWAPEQHLASGLSLDDAVEAVQRGFDDATDEVERAGGALRVGQLLCAMRHESRAREIAELAVRHRGRGVVGFDIAGPEAGFPPSNHRDAFQFLADHLFPVTVHAGEADGPASIKDAIVTGRALRIGHGVRLAEDISIERLEGDAGLATLGEVAQWVLDRQIPLELSPSSNLQTGAIEQWGDALADHPFDLLYQLGFAVTVNTDNRLMSATSITRELALLRETFDYDLDDLLQFQLNAAAGAFLPLEEREDLIDQIADGFADA